MCHHEKICSLRSIAASLCPMFVLTAEPHLLLDIVVVDIVVVVVVALSDRIEGSQRLISSRRVCPEVSLRAPEHARVPVPTWDIRPPADLLIPRPRRTSTPHPHPHPHPLNPPRVSRIRLCPCTERALPEAGRPPGTTQRRCPATITSAEPARLLPGRVVTWPFLARLGFPGPGSGGGDDDARSSRSLFVHGEVVRDSNLARGRAMGKE